MNKTVASIVMVLGIIFIVGALVLAYVIVPGMRVFPDDVDTTREYNVDALLLLDPETIEFTRFDTEPPGEGANLEIVNVMDSPDAAAPDSDATEAAPDPDATEAPVSDEGEEAVPTVPSDGDILAIVDGDPNTFFAPNLHIRRNVLVEEVDGNMTLVKETLGFYAYNSAEEPIREVIKYHALDRSSMEAVEPGDVPDSWQEKLDNQREGIVIGWGPEGVEKRDYTGWSDDYNTTVTLRYVEEQEYLGIDTYYFEAGGPEALPIDDEWGAVIGLPESIGLVSFRALASGLDSDEIDLDDAQRSKLTTTIVAALREAGTPTEVPLNYVYDYQAQYWVEPTTGVLLNTTKREHRAATFPPEIFEAYDQVWVDNYCPKDEDDNPIEEECPATADEYEGSDAFLPRDVLQILMPVTVNEFYYEARDESQEDAKQDALDAKETIDLFSSTVPMGLGVIGILMTVTGAYMATRGGKSGQDDNHITGGRGVDVPKK